MDQSVLALPRPRASADDLAAALLQAAEADAAARADDLHDGALQALVVARYAADLAVRGGDPAVTREAVQEALVALRRAVWQLRPRGEDGLAAALADLSAQRTGAGLPALELDLAPDADRLAPAAAGLAYRVVQASGATRVEARADGGELRLALVDGVLLPGWALRAEALGGRAEPGPVLVLPLPDPAEGDR